MREGAREVRVVLGMGEWGGCCVRTGVVWYGNQRL